MNELLQKHGCANVFNVPEGLRELMADITREVLREQPEKINDFIANYLSVLLITREHGIMAVKIMDDLCDCQPPVSLHLKALGLPCDRAEAVAKMIKEAIENTENEVPQEKVSEIAIVKSILNRFVFDEDTTRKITQIIRNAYRDYIYRRAMLEKILTDNPEEPWETAARHTLEIYKKTQPSYAELARATETIQAAYKGYHVRRNLLRHVQPKSKPGPKVELPGPPTDIAGAREIDLGQMIDIKVKEDNLGPMFESHASNKLGLGYPAMRTITHVPDMPPQQSRGGTPDQITNMNQAAEDRRGRDVSPLGQRLLGPGLKFSESPSVRPGEEFRVLQMVNPKDAAQWQQQVGQAVPMNFKFQQIRQSCQLAFPNGLKDLMSDISREVLRAQPKDLYKFIADYLSVMLVARENLNVATRVTDDVCASECCPEVEDELREMGLSDKDIETTIEIVKEHFEKGEVKESTLLCKLINKTELKETQLPKVLAAVRQAFLKHQYNKSKNIESETNSDMDETTAAAKHTLKLYRQAAELGENYNMAAEKIQAAYRAYNVRRERDPDAPKREKSHEKPVTAGGKAITFGRDGQKAEQQCAETMAFDRCVSKASALSLAGSYITLPPYKPYCANDESDVVESDEDESENVTVIEYNSTEGSWKEEAGRSVSADDFRGPSMIEVPMGLNEIQVLSDGYYKQGAVEGVEEVIHIHELDPKIRVYKTEIFHNMEDHVMVRETDGNRNIHKIIAQNTGIPRSSVDDSKILTFHNLE